MGIEAACECGARFMAADNLAGQVVQCPTCGKSFEVPRPATIAAACSCGAKYQVKASLVGQRVKCAKCQQPFVVTGPSAKRPAASRPAGAAPAARPAPDPFADPLANPNAAQSADLFADPNAAAWDASSGGADDPLGLGGVDLGSSPLDAGAVPFPGSSTPFPGAAPAFGAIPAAGPAARPSAPTEAPPKSRRLGLFIGIGISAVVLLLLFVPLLFSSSSSEPGGFETPLEACNALRAAGSEQNWGAAYDTTTEETQEALTGMCVIYVALNPLQDPDVTAFAQSHGINPATILAEHKLSLANRVSIEAIGSRSLRGAGKAVSNGRSFFIAAMPLLNKAAMASKNGAEKRLSHPLTSDYLVEMSDLRLGPTGLTGVGQIGRRPLWFQKPEGGKWRINFFPV